MTAQQPIQTFEHCLQIIDCYPEIRKILKAKIKLLNIPYGDHGKIGHHDVVLDFFELLTEAAFYQKIGPEEVMQAPVVLRSYREEEDNPNAHPILEAWIFESVYHRVSTLVLDYSPAGIVREELDDHVRQLINQLYQATIKAAHQSQPKIFSWILVEVKKIAFEIINNSVVMRAYTSGEYQNSVELLAVGMGQKSIWDEKVEVVQYNLGLTWEMMGPGA